jgi:hypothetical protein
MQIRRNLGHKLIATPLVNFFVLCTKNVPLQNNPHTAKHRPWRVKTAIAFTDRQRALDFEKYLKSPSGRAFAKKRL